MLYDESGSQRKGQSFTIRIAMDCDSTMHSASLSDGTEAHLWYVWTERVRSQRLQAAYRELMDPSERQRNDRFHSAQRRHEHLVTRALVRTTLSLYHPTVDPATWGFTANQYGRPEVAYPACNPKLFFNLSHTDGLVACLVAAERDIGVDVEKITRSQVGGIEIAESHFSTAEVEDLRSLPASEQRDRFFDYWTLKEAYIKARGLGLQIPLDQFTFHVLARPVGGWRRAKAPPISISFGSQIHDDPGSWQFELLRLTESYRLAMALRRRQAADLRVRIQAVIPLLT